MTYVNKKPYKSYVTVCRIIIFYGHW